MTQFKVSKILGSLLTLAMVKSLASIPIMDKDDALTPLPLAIAHHEGMANLGRKLFFDKQLSKNNDVSCATCHKLNKGGANNLVTSKGTGYQVNQFNTPSIYNVLYSFRYNWDGSAKNYDAIIDQMLIRPDMLGSTWEDVLQKINKSTDYIDTFNSLFNSAASKETIIIAFKEYQKTLITPKSKFDQFLRGNEAALNDEEKAGYRLFHTIGCVSCHQGINVGGNLYQKLGIYKNYYSDRTVSQRDFGKFNLTNNEEDKFVYKVPSLRNVALTAPYFHDGSQATLEDAIQTMAIYQIGKALPATYVKQISAFLETLTGDAPEDSP